MAETCRGAKIKICIVGGNESTDMRRITTFRSTTDRIYESGPIIL